MFKEKVLTVPSSLWEIDYGALGDFVHQAFVDEYGEDAVIDVHVVHYNPSVIDITVSMRRRTEEMWRYALQLGESLRNRGIPVAISVEAEELAEG